jgi:hypothetical protein
MKRAGSPSEAAEFAQLTKRDAQVRMEHELSELLKKCPPEEEQVITIYNCVFEIIWKLALHVNIFAFYGCQIRLNIQSIAIFVFLYQSVAKEFEGFQHIFNKFLQGSGTSIKWEEIERLPGDAVQNYAKLPVPRNEEIQKMLSKLVVIKLNGGLGTSMGCRGPKSVISVR